ncbi:hypothetical protein YDYSG_14010 [Paenibacillus tyrfis]|nr:hypothetical protein [Paenibacillus tyrfis]GLI05371.1 hypothetical protein YDYSG_14010 [Paenibacillus tyrfis]GMX64288.1 hypothetical protein Elgi_35560 [Paenibacillus elgii]
MLNPFELEMQMLEQVKETEKKASGSRFPRVPLMDWLVGVTAISAIFA